MWMHPGEKMLFMGSDFGQWKEWNHDESLQWHLLQWETHQGVQRLVKDLNHMVQREPALHELDFDAHGFEWIDCHDWEESALTFVRRAKNPADHLVVACNFTPVPRMNHRIGVPDGCWYDEVLSSDSQYYGGSNLGNYPGRQAEKLPWDGRPFSINVALPPLAVVAFKPKH
jgi:1,4-alpha-glucan branching enzyme